MKTKRNSKIILATILMLTASLTGCTKNKPVDPNNPNPIQPEPVNPEPVNPEPVDPEPVNPEPVDPEPVNPEPIHSHNWVEVVDDKYLKSPATIDNPAVYYKSCNSCDEVYSDTFEYGEPLKYCLVGDPKESNFESIISTYVDDPTITMIANALGTGLIEKWIGNPQNVKFKRYSFEYETVLLDNSRIVMSGAITFPCLNGEPFVRFIDVDNHPTFTDASEAPSKGFDIYCITTIIGALVIECDLLGYGRTEEYPTDYHCRHLATRNTVDGILAALDLIKNEISISIDNLDMFNTGYSQGGYDSMALMRYMETEATEEEKAKINFKETFSGSGAYDLAIMFEDSLKKADFMFPEYILMALITAHEFHPEIFGDTKIEDFLTDYGKLFIEPILNKNDAAVQELKNKTDDGGNLIYKTPSDFFTFDISNPDPTLYKIMKDYCDEENLLDGKWMPKGLLYIYYSPDDELVSPNCSLKAKELFKDLENVEISDGSGDHRTSAIYYYLEVIDSINLIYDEE